MGKRHPLCVEPRLFRVLEETAPAAADVHNAVACLRIEFADQDLELASLRRLEGRAVLVKDGAAVRAIFVVEKQAVEGRRQVIML